MGDDACGAVYGAPASRVPGNLRPQHEVVEERAVAVGRRRQLRGELGEERHVELLHIALVRTDDMRLTAYRGDRAQGIPLEAVHALSATVGYFCS